MVYIVFDKIPSGSGVATLVNKFTFNGDFNQKERLFVVMAMQKLAEELHWPVIRKFEKRKVSSSFKEKIWGAVLADMHLISKLDKGIRFLLCVVIVLSKDACVLSLKDKKGRTIVNAFQSILNNLKRNLR